MEPLPWVFDMLQYFENILPSLKSVSSSQRDELYFMGGMLMEAYDIPQNGRHLGRHQRFYPEIEIS